MRKANFLVFDDYIKVSSPAVFTPAELNQKIGAYDQLALMVLVDNLNNNTDGFDVWMAHSGDDRNWIYRQNIKSSQARPGTGDVHWDISTGGNPLVTNNTNMLAYMDGGATPIQSFVRLEMSFSSTHTAGHVRLYVTQRDQGA